MAPLFPALLEKLRPLPVRLDINGGGSPGTVSARI